MATDPNQFANVQLSDNFNTWRTRTNQMAAALSSNTFTVANTVHAANGAAKAITYGHGILYGSISSNMLFANTHLSGGEYGRHRTLKIISNTHIDGRIVVANDAVFGMDGNEEVLLNSRLLAEANATFRETVRMDADVYIGTDDTDSLTVESISRFNSNVHIDGDTISLTGNTQIGGANTDTFLVNAVSTFDADVAFRDEVTLSANVLMSGANVVITGDTNTQDVTSTTLRVDGATLVANDGVSTFTVGGPSRLLNTTLIDSTLNVTGATSLNETTVTTLAANGTSSLNSVTATTIQANGTLNVDGATTLNGAVTLGDATADDLTFTGRVASSVLPKTNNTYDLGSSSLTYGTTYTAFVEATQADIADVLNVGGLSALNDVTTTGITANGFTTLYSGAQIYNGLTVYGDIDLGFANTDTLTVNADAVFNGDATFNNQTAFTNDVAFTGDEVVIDSNLTIGTDFVLTATEGRYANLEISNTSIFEGNVVFGVVNGNPATRVTFTSNVGSDILPHSTGSYDLGSSTKKWEDIHSSGTINYTNMTATSSTGTVTFPQIGSSMVPLNNNQYNLGSNSKQWKDLHVDGTGYIDTISSDSVTTTTLTASNPANFTVGTATIQEYGRAQISATDAGGDGSLAYNSSTGTITYTGPSATETRAHFSASNSGTGYGSLSYNSTSGAFTYTKVTSANIRGNFKDDIANTAAVTFGSLNYYSSNGAIQLVPVERREVRGSISATNSGSGYGSISYNNDTGVITYTKVSSGNIRGLITDKVANTESTYFGSLNYYSSNGVIELVPVGRSQVRGSLSGGTGVTYSSTTGQISIGQSVATTASPTFGGQTINGTASMRSITVQNGTHNIGTYDNKHNTIYANTFDGVATKAKYADLAEKYLADQTYATGTVVCVGGTAEVTASTGGMAHAVVGVVSENPAYMMNSDLEGGTYIALKGRVPVKIEGSVTKGCMLAAGDEGRAVAFADVGRPFAIALEDGSYDTETETGTDTIEAFIM